MYELRKFKPSQVGAACILSARKIVKITPMWNNTIKDLLQIEYADVEKPFKILYSFYKKCFNQFSPSGSSSKENIQNFQKPNQ